MISKSSSAIVQNNRGKSHRLQLITTTFILRFSREAMSGCSKSHFSILNAVCLKSFAGFGPTRIFLYRKRYFSTPSGVSQSIYKYLGLRPEHAWKINRQGKQICPGLKVKAAVSALVSAIQTSTSHLALEAEVHNCLPQSSDSHSSVFNPEKQCIVDQIIGWNLIFSWTSDELSAATRDSRVLKVRKNRPNSGSWFQLSLF